MINIDEERLLSMAEAAKYIGHRFARGNRSGRPLNLATVYRWSERGLRGTKLETISIGGSRATSIEALQRFFDRLDGSGAGASSVPTAPVGTVMSGRRKRRLASVESELDRRLGA